MSDLLGSVRQVYDYYPIGTGYGFTLPSGHGGGVAVDPTTGETKCHEYGRYDDENLGIVRNVPIPNLVMENDKMKLNSDPNREPYNLLNNNCKMFANDTISAGKNK